MKTDTSSRHIIALVKSLHVIDFVQTEITASNVDNNLIIETQSRVTDFKH